jgi:hypothetical protein
MGYAALGEKKMADCYEGMRAALRRNIEGLAHLSADQKEALLESQMGAAIAASEAGRPFVEIYPQESSPKLEEDFESEEAPTPRTRNPQAQPKARHAGFVR